MNALVIALFILPCMFGGALLGLKLRTLLPDSHFNTETKSSIQLALGLIISMTALILGLVVASAKNNFDTQDAAIKESAASIITLDRMLADYGPETINIRASVRRSVLILFESTWPERSFRSVKLDIPKALPLRENILAQIQALTPKTDAQRWLQTQSLLLASDLLKIRSLVLERFGSSVPVLFLIIITFWLTLIFSFFGLLAIRNGTIIVVFFCCALSVAAAIFLILEMDGPFDGFIKVSGEPFRYVLTHIGQ
jgi:hypothetical protein